MNRHHRDTHPQYVPDCIACKVLSIRLSAEATPNRRPQPVDINRRDKVLEKDLAAYKRLRHDGLQPRGIDGSAAAENRVNSQFDFTYGRYFSRSEETRVAEAVGISKELGLMTENGQ